MKSQKWGKYIIPVISLCIISSLFNGGIVLAIVIFGIYFLVCLESEMKEPQEKKKVDEYNEARDRNAAYNWENFKLLRDIEISDSLEFLRDNTMEGYKKFKDSIFELTMAYNKFYEIWCVREELNNPGKDRKVIAREINHKLIQTLADQIKNEGRITIYEDEEGKTERELAVLGADRERFR